MLQIESVYKQYSTRVLLKDVTAHLRPGSRVGLVGPNGAGKTTLFRMILEEESPDKGTIRKRPRLRIGYLPQELETITGKTVLDATHRDLYPEHEAERILMGLGFTEIDFGRLIEKLSGGYRMRVALTHLLLSNPDVLLLDEPTNHLDKPTQRWFEQYLLNSEMTLLIISHDTAFLDRVVTHIWDLRHHKIEEYRGNYTSFKKIRAERDAQRQAAAGRQAKEIARVQTFGDRFRYQANKASQVQSRIKQLEKVKMIEIQRDPKRVKFKFPLPAASGRQVLELQSVAKRYGEKVVYEKVDCSIERGQRVALVGENGAGKSTLLKMLAGALAFEKGTRTVGHGVTLHYFAQHQAETLNPEHTILDSLSEVSSQAETNFLRGIAGAFLFTGDDQKKPIKALSGGERKRVIEIEEGNARSLSGDYEYYLWKKAQEVESIKETSDDLKGVDRGKDVGPTRAMASQAPSKPSAGDLRDLNKTQARLEKQIARAEAEIAEYETKIKARDLELADPALYKDESTKWSALHLEQDGWKKELVRLTVRWETLSAELDGVK